VRGSLLKDIAWYRADGAEMTTADWVSPSARSVGMLLSGDAIPTLDRYGRPVVGDTLLILVNGSASPLSFVLPVIQSVDHWEVLVDTRSAAPPESPLRPDSCHVYAMLEKSVAVLALPKAPSVTLPPSAPPSQR
jgi:glycogen operon protein